MVDKTFDQMTDTERLQTIAIEKRKLNKDKKQPTAILKAFSEIAPEPIDWLWQDRIAIGKLTIYAGDPGLGKSQGTLDLAARLSTGRNFPDGSPCIVGDTIILSSEDDPGDTIRPRLDALEADVSRINIIKGEIDSNGKIKPMTLKKIDSFMDAVLQIRERGHIFSLLIIDPLDSFLEGMDSNCNEDVREALDGICELAEKERFAIVGIKHLNKGGGNAAYRVGGSIAFTAKARSVWVFTQDRESGRRLFLPQKNNLGAGGGGFEYSIQKKDIGGIIAPYIYWEAPANDDLQEVLNPQGQGRDKAPEQEAILQLLADSKKVMKTGEIAKALGKSEQAISNALGRLKARDKVYSPTYGQWGILGVSVFTKEVTHLHTYTHTQGGVTSESTNDIETYTPIHEGVKPCNCVTVKVEGEESELDIY